MKSHGVSKSPFSGAILKCKLEMHCEISTTTIIWAPQSGTSAEGANRTVRAPQTQMIKIVKILCYYAEQITAVYGFCATFASVDTSAPRVCLRALLHVA